MTDTQIYRMICHIRRALEIALGQASSDTNSAIGNALYEAEKLDQYYNRRVRQVYVGTSPTVTRSRATTVQKLHGLTWGC